MSEYTPGPWEIGEWIGEWRFDGGFRIIRSGPVPMVKGILARAGYLPNARLIAAAPDLLHACRQALADSLQRERVTNTEGVETLMRAAIRKAEGRDA